LRPWYHPSHAGSTSKRKAKPVPVAPRGPVHPWAAKGRVAGPALRPCPTAVLAATDVLAIGVIHGAAAEGISVPARLSVVGFDDLPFAAAAVPPLTTLHMPIAEMGAAAIDLAVATLTNNTRKPKGQTLQAELVVRASTAPPPRQEAV
jgi:DNA-binding LacI/PurR family transcriptional regulator